MFDEIPKEEENVVAKQHRSKLDIAANIAVLVVCFMLIGLLAQKWFFTKTSSAAAPSTITKGSQINLNTVDWSASENTLLLVLQKGCRFCTESAPFYQRLMSETAANTSLRVVAVLPTGVDESRDYLRGLNVDIPDVQQGSLSSLGVRGTPTLILVDKAGKVVESWVGKLPPEKEQAVFQIVSMRQQS